MSVPRHLIDKARTLLRASDVAGGFDPQPPEEVAAG